MSIRRKVGAVISVAAIAAIVTVTLAMVGVLSVGAAADQQPVTVQANVSTEGSVTVVDISITNNTSNGLGGFEIQGLMPESGKLVGASPSNYRFDGTSVDWIRSAGLAAGKTLVGYQYKIDGAAGNVVINVKYWGTSTGAASSGPVSVGNTSASNAGAKVQPVAATSTQPAATATPEPPRRGCLACHVLVDKTKGNYTLGFEANERAEADYGAEHPVVSPSGAKIDPLTQASVTACLECHAPSKDNPEKGIGAPITLRDIVHPAHIFSKAFTEHYNGTCFTCHNVRGDGTFELLGDKVDVNVKGVPKSLLAGEGKIPGEVLPSEGGH